MAEVLSPPESQLHSSPSGLLHRSSSRSSLANLPYSSQHKSLSSPALALHQEDDDDDDASSSTQSTSSWPNSPIYTDPSLASTQSDPSTTWSLDFKTDPDEDDDLFPSYDPSNVTSQTRFVPVQISTQVSPDNTRESSDHSSETTPPNGTSSPDIPHVADDSEAKAEPSRQVDYLSHDWREEDIWSSWRHIVSQRRTYGERSRLENASWRTWAKQKNHLKTVSPEKLNWLKDCDVTWLYGPLHQRHPQKESGSDATSHLSKSNSFINKKPILKKRSASEVMLQRSISQSSLVRQAAAAVQAQRKSFSHTERPSYNRTRSDFARRGSPAEADFTGAFPSATSSGLESPDAGISRRHIRFDDKVEQCIAVEFKEGEDDEDMAWNAIYSDTSSEDDLPMMKPTQRRFSSNASSGRNSFTSEQKGIAMLPSTTLKTDDGQNSALPTPTLGSSIYRSGTLKSSDSQETLRPSNPSTNFLIHDDSDEEDMWQPSGAFSRSQRTPSSVQQQQQQQDHHRLQPRRVDYAREDAQEHSKAGLRRTGSGMFMPYEEDEEEAIMNTGLFGRIVDTVNTARDIAHVVWNVGWRK